MRGGASIIAALTPVKAFLRRFVYLLLIGAAVGLMLIGKVETVIVESVRGHVADIVAPVLDAASRSAAMVRDFVDHAHELAALREQNARLREENATLLQWQLAAKRLDDENESLKRLLNFHPGPTASYITARVIADTGGAFVRSVLVNVGKSAGVREDQAVISGEGLVGRVVHVGERTARVLLMTDLNSRIPVVVGQGRTRAILGGDNRDNPRLLHVEGEAMPAPGELVATSGEGGVFRPGLPIGVVAGQHDHGFAVQTFVDWNRLEYVRVVDYPPRSSAALDGRREAPAAGVGLP